jgi:hypothetical protein
VKQRAGTTTPTDSRSRRIRASRRGGQLLTRARSPSNETGLPVHVCLRAPLSRTVAPYSPPQTQSAPDTVAGITRRLRPFIPDTNSIENLNRQVRKAIKTRGSFPDEQAATKLIYLAIHRAQRSWENAYHWPAAIRAFKIRFGNRIPD